MKKFFSTLIALTCITGCFCSCSSQTSESESGTGNTKRASTLPIDPEIIGTWMNDYNGYDFGDDRKMSLIINFSERGHFTSDGAFQTLGGLIPKENVSYDGSRLYVTNTVYEEQYGEDVTSVLIDMERLDDKNPDSFNGEYKIYGGIATDMLADELGIETNHLTFEGKIEDETLIITIVDCFDYETRGETVDIFSEYLKYVNESANSLTYVYKIEGDTLTMTFTDAEGLEPEIYTKVTE